VIFSLRSPVMGGNSRWNILTDGGLSSTLPEVFAPPPDILSGCLHHEVQRVFQKRNPFIWEFVKARKIFVGGSSDDRAGTLNTKMAVGLGARLSTWARASVVDRLWRG
jgi:tRNA(adenine34) deaminase